MSPCLTFPDPQSFGLSQVLQCINLPSRKVHLSLDQHKRRNLSKGRQRTLLSLVSLNKTEGKAQVSSDVLKGISASFTSGYVNVSNHTDF